MLNTTLTIFGFHIELLLFLQLLVTAVIITIYFLMYSLKVKNADYISSCNTILLTCFLVKFHPEINSLQDISKASIKDIEDKNSEIYWLSKFYDDFNNSGIFFSYSLAAEDCWSDRILAFLLSPIFSVVGLWVITSESRHYRYQRILHTELRQNHISQFIIFLAIDICYIFIALEIIIHNLLMGFFALIVAVIGVVAAIMCILIYIVGQQIWKDYWLKKLLDVMAFATKEENHDLFNRAMILKTYIESQPNIPVPGNLGFFALVYSGVQALLLLIFKVM